MAYFNYLSIKLEEGEELQQEVFRVTEMQKELKSNYLGNNKRVKANQY